ncbi:MAG: SpoIID/LytB domain-containing protein [Candidatus Riflebacteria bacterium]|nr:SpoIID/LytB domain-containing protein [Candidatus Riflebacteria bacterium]
MSKQNIKYLQILVLMFCFAFLNGAEAAKDLESKVIPITPKNYRKDPTEPKKAVRKPTTTTTAQTKASDKTSSVSTPKTTIKASSAIKIPSKTTTITESSGEKDVDANKTSLSSLRLSTSQTSKTPASSSTTSKTSVSNTSSNTKAATSASNISSNAKAAVSSSYNANNKKSSVTTSKTQLQTQNKTSIKPTNSISQTTKTVEKSSTKVTTKPQKLKEEKTTRKERIPEPVLKVKIGTELHTKISIVLPNGGSITNSKGKHISHLKNNGTFNWTSVVDKKSKKKKKIEYLNDILYVKPNKNIFTFNGTEYRGKLSLKLTEKGGIAVNEVPIEDYLRGVVGREIGASSPQESLKAQTVIARTYAYANKGRHGADGADVCSTTHCQVYFGVKAESASVDKAIKDTRGYILTYNTKPISALYHATCGGMTSNNEEVWGGNPEPFLRRVPCNFCEKGSKYRWTKEIPMSEMRTTLSKENVKLDTVYSVSIEAPSLMDRVSYVVFQTKTGEQKVRGTTIRRIFNLPSTTFILDDREEKANLLALAKEKKLRYEENSKPIQYKNIPSILITSFSETQYSPKQLLVYTSKGLKLARIPAEGWKCISYNPLGKTIAISDESVDNNKRRINNSSKSITTTTIKTPNKKKILKPVEKISLFGRGFGHQVGLCQSGAVEMGKIGWNYRQILAHYYQGVALKNLGY